MMPCRILVVRVSLCGMPHSSCPCGCAWFRLLPNPDAAPNERHAAIALNLDGSVLAYLGQPHCLGCGRPWLPAGPPRLTVLEGP
jgi:hypothetical protein